VKIGNANTENQASAWFFFLYHTKQTRRPNWSGVF